MTTRKRTDSAGSSASNKSKEEEEVGHKKAKLEDPVIEDAPNTEDAPKEQDEKSREENTEREDRPPVADDDAPLQEEGEELDCRDCGNKFIFSKGEQEFFAMKGFTNKPSRCKECKMKKRNERDGGRGKPVCYAFQRGECNRGEECRYAHESGGGGGGGGYDRGGRGGYDRGGRGGGGDRPRGVCYAFQRGDCSRGSDCRFAHESGGGGGGGGYDRGGGGGYDRGSRSYNDRGDRGGDRGDDRPCFDFQKGRCDRGSGCRFSHTQ
jgi:cleavage and polyadenylation specificity factor subunit 4|eukprot:Stramenopile-MAST_4_protein_1832